MPELSLAVEIGKIVREWRMERKVSQEEFAYRCGVHRTYMTHLEKGAHMPSVEVIARIARGCGTEISALFLELESRGVSVLRVTDPPTAKWG